MPCIAGCGFLSLCSRLKMQADTNGEVRASWASYRSEDETVELCLETEKVCLGVALVPLHKQQKTGLRAEGNQ